MVGWHTDSMDMSLSKFWELVMGREAWCAAILAVAKSWTWLRDWTELDPWIKSPHFFMPSGHFTMDQMYGLKVNDHYLFFPQPYGTEFNYYPSLDPSVPIVHQTKDIFQELRTMEWDVYSKQDWGLIHWLPSNFDLILTLNNTLSSRQKRMLSERRVSYGRLPGRAQ